MNVMPLYTSISILSLEMLLIIMYMILYFSVDLHMFTEHHNDTDAQFQSQGNWDLDI